MTDEERQALFERLLDKFGPEELEFMAEMKPEKWEPEEITFTLIRRPYDLPVGEELDRVMSDNHVQVILCNWEDMNESAQLLLAQFSVWLSYIWHVAHR